jgi:DNA repair protein RadC
MQLFCFYIHNLASYFVYLFSINMKCGMNEYKKLVIKDWAAEDRPREKFLAKGISALSDSELLAILIHSGNREETAVELSQKILRSVRNNLNELGKLTVRDLQKFKGMGQAKAIAVVAAMELGKRRVANAVIEKKQITKSSDVFELFSPQLGDLPYEEFWVLFLNRSNRLIEKIKISQGGISATVTDVRIILRHAIELQASSMIVCHNHPSGGLKPSQPDIDITKKLADAGQIMDVKLLDHLIVSDTSFFSFADEGLL